MGKMNKSSMIWALVALNVALLLLFVTRGTGDKPALAQGVRPGDYLMIPGDLTSGTNSVVYVVDQSSHQLIAMSYDDSSNKLDLMQALNLDRIFNAGNRAPARRMP